jgi:hypothetical protein
MAKKCHSWRRRAKVGRDVEVSIGNLQSIKLLLEHNRLASIGYSLGTLADRKPRFFRRCLLACFFRLRA